MQIYTLIILASFLLIGCASKGLDKTDGWSAQKLYEEARSELNVGNYETAVSVYQKLSSRFPFGKYAQQGSLDIAYAHWKNGDLVLLLQVWTLQQALSKPRWVRLRALFTWLDQF